MDIKQINNGVFQIWDKKILGAYVDIYGLARQL